MTDSSSGTENCRDHVGCQDASHKTDGVCKETKVWAGFSGWSSAGHCIFGCMFKFFFYAADLTWTVYIESFFDVLFVGCVDSWFKGFPLYALSLFYGISINKFPHSLLHSPQTFTAFGCLDLSVCRSHRRFHLRCLLE